MGRTASLALVPTSEGVGFHAETRGAPACQRWDPMLEKGLVSHGDGEKSRPD